MKNNILVWPRAAGIGDAFCVLAEGLRVFNEQPFEIIIGRETPFAIQYDPTYKQHYENIFNTFALCQNFTFMNFETDDEVKAYASSHLSPHNNVHLVSDMGYKNTHTHGSYIQKNFPKYYQPKVDSRIKSLYKPYQLNICVHMKIMRKKNSNEVWPGNGALKRSIDLEKWIAFLKFLSHQKNVNIIVIGVSDSRSPSYTSREDLSQLLNLSNITFPFLEKASILNDTYLIKNCDLFIGGHSGPTSIAWLFSRPTLAYDMNYLRHVAKSAKDGFFKMRYNQKTLWGLQPLSQMQQILLTYIKTFFKENHALPEKELSHSLGKKLKNEITQALALFKENNTLNSWESHEEAYYRLGLNYLEKGNYSKAKELFNQSYAYLDIEDKYQFFKIARLFKDGKEFQEAERYFKQALGWAQSDNQKDIQSASHFHLGEIYYLKHEYPKAMEEFEKCLKLCPQHKKANDYIQELPAQP